MPNARTCARVVISNLVRKWSGKWRRRGEARRNRGRRGARFSPQVPTTYLHALKGAGVADAVVEEGGAKASTNEQKLTPHLHALKNAGVADAVVEKGGAKVAQRGRAAGLVPDDVVRV